MNTPCKLCRELGGVSDDKCSIKIEGTLRNWCFFFIKKAYELLWIDILFFSKFSLFFCFLCGILNKLIKRLRGCL